MIETRGCNNYVDSGMVRKVDWTGWGGGVWGRKGTCICMAESLCGPPKTTTTLLIGYTAIQNKKVKKER